MAEAAGVAQDSRSLGAIQDADLSGAYRALGLAARSDHDLFELVARVVTRPKTRWISSFVLHAPLELLAREGLLRYVATDARERARMRILWIGTRYAAAAHDAEDAQERPVGDARAATRTLADAITAGDTATADAVASALARELEPAALSAALAELILPRMSSAAHGTIALHLMPRVAPASRAIGFAARALARDAAAAPQEAFTWHLQRRAGSSPGRDLAQQLCAARLEGASPGGSIVPVMNHVDKTGRALATLDAPLRATAPDAAARTLTRVAAWSMLQDDPAHAPYGWSHCLTLAQAALGLMRSVSDAQLALAVAAGGVLGFRCALGKRALDPSWVPPAPSITATDADLGNDPDLAAAAAWHAPPDRIPAIIARIAGAAAGHQDAHVAKYTLACLDARAADPVMAHLYLAAAAYLNAWWRAHPGEDAMG